MDIMAPDLPSGYLYPYHHMLIKMKNVLIPTDFSKNARNAEEYAMELLKGQRCTFYFLHTYTPSFYRMDYVLGGPAFSAIPDRSLDISQAGLEKTLDDARQKYGNPRHTYEMVSAFNILTDEINELADDKMIDLVIMGTQGATGAKEIFLGSNTVYVIRKSKIPVLAVPAGFSFRPVNNILFPTDYLSHYKEGELRVLIELAKFHRAIVTVLHVKQAGELSTVQQQNRVHLENSLQQIPYKSESIESHNIPEAIIEYADTSMADLIVMMRGRHSFMQNLLLRQKIDRIGFHLKVPLLVIPDSAKKKD